MAHLDMRASKWGTSLRTLALIVSPYAVSSATIWEPRLDVRHFRKMFQGDLMRECSPARNGPVRAIAIARLMGPHPKVLDELPLEVGYIFDGSCGSAFVGCVAIQR